MENKEIISVGVEESKSKKPTISDSAERMLIRCGTQYEFRYIKGIRIPPGVAQVTGTATHKTVNLDLNYKKDKGELMKLDEIKDSASDSIKMLFQNGVKLNEEEKKEGDKKLKAQAQSDAINLSALHHGEIAPAIQPLHIERYFKLEMKNQPMDLAGRMDVEEVNGGLRDTKTSAKSPSQKEVDVDDQLTIYSLAKKIETGKLPTHLSMDYLVKTKTPKVVIAETVRTQKDIDRIIYLFDHTMKFLKLGMFMPNPNGWWCSKSWCGYWDRCPFWSGRE